MDRMLWARFGEATLKAPHAVQWLSDNGPQYTATATVLYAHELGLVPLTMPAYSPQSNGLAEAFVKTVKRDYVDGAELRDAEAVLAQLSGWIEDYNTRAPHSALGMRSPADYRADTTLSSSPVSRTLGSTPPGHSSFGCFFSWPCNAARRCYLTPSIMQVPPGRYTPPWDAQMSLACFGA